jgi:nitronate monooxygenase
VLETELTRRFDLTVPVVLAPMAGAAGGALAAAVSGAGGLGMIGVSHVAPPEWIRKQAALAAAGGRPYGVGLLAWSRPETTGQLAAVLALDPLPALVSVSYGDPPGDERRHRPPLAEAGCAVAAQVGTVPDALHAVENGFDLIVVRGGEGGGHGRNLVGTLPLLQGTLDALERAGSRVPVLAAGGIGGPSGLAAVLAAGAAGAWVGTAFLACPESLTREAATARLLSAGLTDTVYTGAFDRGFSLGWPEEFGGRALRNRFTDTWTGREGGLETDEDARAQLAAARAAGDFDLDHIYAGQGVGLLQEVRPAAAVVADLAGAEALLRRW